MTTHNYCHIHSTAWIYTYTHAHIWTYVHLTLDNNYVNFYLSISFSLTLCLPLSFSLCIVWPIAVSFGQLKILVSCTTKIIRYYALIIRSLWCLFFFVSFWKISQENLIKRKTVNTSIFLFLFVYNNNNKKIMEINKKNTRKYVFNTK